MALQDDALNKFFGWQSQGGGGPITSGAGGREIGQDIIEATFDTGGVAHQRYAADKAAEEAAKVKYAADQAKYQQDLQTYQQETARIAQENAAREAQNKAAADQAAQQAAADQQAQQAAAAASAAANAPNPYATYYGLTARQQRKISANPRAAQRRGIALPPAGYVQPTNTAVATGSTPWKSLQAPTEPLAPLETPNAPGAAPPEPLWKSYNQYYGGNEAATTNYAKATPAQQQAWGAEYNKYKSGLPLIYQDLINYGISPEAVMSGQAKTLQRQFGQEIIPTDYNQAMKIYGTTRGGPSDQGVGLMIAQPGQGASQYSSLPTSFDSTKRR